jgi:hypothetical protein
MIHDSSSTIRVDLDSHGRWDVALPGSPDHIKCATLAEARRLAHQYADSRRPCELVVCDAYHRVLERRLIDGAGARRAPH